MGEGVHGDDNEDEEEEEEDSDKEDIDRCYDRTRNGGMGRWKVGSRLNLRINRGSMGRLIICLIDPW